MLTEAQQDQLEAWRTEATQYVIQALDAMPPAKPNANPDKHRYRFLVEDQAVRLPRKSGLYVIYSVLTNRPLYVAHSDTLKVTLMHELNVTKDSPFKNRWVRAWLNLPRDRRPTREESEQITAFITAQTYFKFLAVPFGRAEIADALILQYGIKGGPNTIDPLVEFTQS